MTDNIITGRAKKFDGAAIDYVSIFNWSDGKCIAQVVPDAAGVWEYEYYGTLKVGFVYVGDGCEPISHGPYDFVATDAPIVVNGDFKDGLNGWINQQDHWSGIKGVAYHPLTTIPLPLTQRIMYVGNAVVTVDVTVLKGQIVISIEGTGFFELGVGTHKLVKNAYLSNSVFFTHRLYGFNSEYYVSKVTVKPV